MTGPLKFYVFNIFAISIAMLSQSCVSVSIGAKSPEENSRRPFEATPPVIPYQLLSNGSFKLTSGRILLSLQDCMPNADLPLEILSRESLKNLTDPKVLEEKSVLHQGRRSVQIIAQGELDGLQIKMMQQVLKKDGCSYFFTLSGSPKNFEQDLQSFSDWVQAQELP
jgi:hypothetical protein